MTSNEQPAAEPAPAPPPTPEPTKNAGGTPRLRLRYAARSDIGLVRQGNEDSGYAGGHMLVVADGMGGHAAGELASATAVATFAELDREPPGDEVLTALADAVDQAHEELRRVIGGAPDFAGMGTTVTALSWEGDRVALAHVGDSRAYLLRDGELNQLTKDHTFVQTLVDAGRITPEEAGINSQFKGTKIGATETIFEYMAQATGLVITTPPGFIKAIATESEPSAKDVGTFREQLSNGTDEVLIYNSQTEGGLTSQMRTVAEANNVPVVDVTESLNPSDATFQAWQLAQLELLSSALSQSNTASANTATAEKYDRAVVLVSGLATQSPFTTPTQACRSGTPAGVSDSALRAGLLQANRNVFTAPTQIGSSQVMSATGLGAFSDCPPALPTSMTINTADRLNAGGINLARFIEYLHQIYGVKDVDLVGHSMGGLFATAALSRLKADSSPVTVRSLSTLSAPWTGVFAADYAADQLKTKACRSQPVCTKILIDYKKLAIEEGPQGAAIQVTSQFLAGPTGWVARQKSALRDVPVTLIGGDYFRKSPGNAGVWPNDTLVALASAHATSVGDDVIPSRFCVTRPDVHTLNFAQELNLPDSSAITWDPEVIAAVNQAIARTDAPAAHPNRTGCIGDRT